MSIEVIPVEGLPEIRPHDDLGSMIRDVLPPLVDGDVIAVTQKVVSKAEGRVVEGDRAAHVASESRRLLAQRGDLVIAETRHGFVCANAGVDASNVSDGFVSLLPEDPDGSAERLRQQLGAPVVITDTFGRPWRLGLVNVAIGCAGLPALVDLRGTRDATGRMLEATVIALADEIAAASGLVMGKSSDIPVALIRGIDTSGGPDVPARELVRPADEDLFRESPLMSISARRTIRSFGPGVVPRAHIEEAVRAACTAPAPHHTRPWLFVVVDSQAARRALTAAMASAWRGDLEADGLPEEVIEGRLSKSDAILAAAPSLIVPFMNTIGAHDYTDLERRMAEREMFLLSAGAAIQNLLLALHAQGLASAWVSSTLFCKEEARRALGIGEEWSPVGAIAVGRPPAGTPPPRPDLDLSLHLGYR